MNSSLVVLPRPRICPPHAVYCVLRAEVTGTDRHILTGDEIEGELIDLLIMESFAGNSSAVGAFANSRAAPCSNAWQIPWDTIPGLSCKKTLGNLSTAGQCNSRPDDSQFVR